MGPESESCHKVCGLITGGHFNIGNTCLSKPGDEVDRMAYPRGTCPDEQRKQSQYSQAVTFVRMHSYIFWGKNKNRNQKTENTTPNVSKGKSVVLGKADFRHVLISDVTLLL